MKSFLSLKKRLKDGYKMKFIKNFKDINKLCRNKKLF